MSRGNPFPVSVSGGMCEIGGHVIARSLKFAGPMRRVVADRGAQLRFLMLSAGPRSFLPYDVFATPGNIHKGLSPDFS